MPDAIPSPEQPHNIELVAHIHQKKYRQEEREQQRDLNGGVAQFPAHERTADHPKRTDGGHEKGPRRSEQFEDEIHRVFSVPDRQRKGKPNDDDRTHDDAAEDKVPVSFSVVYGLLR